MAYDEDLANRIREQLADETGITEQRMFGGLGFMLGGHLFVGARGKGGLIARVDPGESDEALSEPHASLMEMRGRRLPGWIIVGPEGVDQRRAARRLGRALQGVSCGRCRRRV
jgi:hypothetical protein